MAIRKVEHRGDLLSRTVDKLPKYDTIAGVVGKEPDTGHTAKTVAANVERLRTAQNMNYKQLSERLQSEANWSINAVGIRRIESGERRVTPDDLVALAVALDVSPATLLMPPNVDMADPVRVTGLADPAAAIGVWEWLRGPPGPPRSVRRSAWNTWPRWEQEQILGQFAAEGSLSATVEAREVGLDGDD